MNGNVEFEIRNSIRRLFNAKKKAGEICAKIEKLERELNLIEKRILQERELIVTLGRKNPSEDQFKPDSAEEAAAKEAHNQRLLQEKSELLKEFEINPALFFSDSASESLSDFDAAMKRLGLEN